MELACEVYKWTPSGMSKWDGFTQGYLRKADAERLLAEAYQRGVRQGAETAMQVIKETSL